MFATSLVNMAQQTKSSSPASVQASVPNVQDKPEDNYSADEIDSKFLDSLPSSLLDDDRVDPGVQDCRSVRNGMQASVVIVTICSAQENIYSKHCTAIVLKE